MSDSMIERVARAICAAQGFDWEAQADGMTSASGGDNEQEGYIELARAAIEAMREPTVEMVSKSDPPDMPAGGSVEDIWCNMIDAALKETE